jgi:hypothetical protein
MIEMERQGNIPEILDRGARMRLSGGPTVTVLVPYLNEAIGNVIAEFK